MVSEYKIGQMVPNMWEIGAMIGLMAKENYIMHQETFMKVNGKTIKHMAKEHTTKKMGENMKVIGLRINSKDMEWRHFQMDQNTKENSKKE